MAEEEDINAGAFVNALYQKVLLSVKASNAIPSENDGFHYHSQFTADFAARSKHSGAKVEELVRLLIQPPRSDADESEDNHIEELFDGPEPNARIIDYADMLLDEASKHLANFMRGNKTTSSALDSKLRPLENKPQIFEKKQNVEKKELQSFQKSSWGSQDKPQKQFDEKIDNSDVPFVSKLRDKVHAGVNAVDNAAIEDISDDTDARNPYDAEIKGLKHASWQLTVSNEPYAMVELDEASYLWVDTEENLLLMMKSLRAPEARVIAVDLEHHSYRSYMGLTCLMQISTAREDFLVDTLALRSKLQTLNHVFCDPSKVKVLHGSDMDILWLQRDLGLYIVNLFDTGRAARLLQYPRFSLAYLLKRHCNIDADKQYQLADWRKRPLDSNMVKYAREDTRYLLYIYDRLKKELLQQGGETRVSLLVQALRDSNQLCLQVYAKPQPSEEEALAIGEKLKGMVNLRDLSALHKRVIRALYFWRDKIARQEDESVAYVMPNHVLLKLTKHLPVRSDELLRVCNPVPVLVRKHVLEITKLIIAEKIKFTDEEVPLRVETVNVKSVQRKTWELDGHETTVMNSKQVGRGVYPLWKRGLRQARVAIPKGTLNSGNRSIFAHESSVLETKQEVAMKLLDKVNAMVASTRFTITESAPVLRPVFPPTSLIANASSMETHVEEGKSTPLSISETYNLSNRTKRRKITAVDKTRVAHVKDRAQACIEKFESDDGKIETTTEARVFQGFDYASASTQVTGAKLQLQTEETENRQGRGRGGRGRQSTRSVGYNPFVAMKSTELKEPKAAQVKKKHHMPRSATFR
ncbi:hypothetical protein CCR75_000334 [Bremia lactucae]|uniref:HRDC domain-containing protein n=1 Tax=Bremia lactucae TaxID=4779 RepID=A0A976FLE8_BRELC|nr:hypothetical protein CCR75_000334 [Bremia lactucae]